MTFSEKLKVAVYKGDFSTVRDLLGKKRLPFEKYKDGKSLLHFASQSGNVEMAKLLVFYGFDVNAKDNNCYTPLHLAAAQGHLDVVKMLIDSGAEVDQQDIFGNTPVHAASWNGYSESLALLISYQANVNVVNKAGFTALHTAAQRGHNQSARVLIHAGSFLKAKNNYGETPLHTSTRYGHAGVTQILINNKVKIDSRNKNRETALHLSATFKRNKIAKMLIDAGANKTLKNKQGETAFDIGRKCSCDEGMLLMLLYDKNKKYLQVTKPLNKPISLDTKTHFGFKRNPSIKSSLSSKENNSKKASIAVQCEAFEIKNTDNDHNYNNSSSNRSDHQKDTNNPMEHINLDGTIVNAQNNMNCMKSTIQCFNKPNNLNKRTNLMTSKCINSKEKANLNTKFTRTDETGSNLVSNARFPSPSLVLSHFQWEKQQQQEQHNALNYQKDLKKSKVVGNVTNKNNNVIGLLHDYTPKTGLVYYKDLAGNLKEGPVGWAPISTNHVCLESSDDEDCNHHYYEHISHQPRTSTLPKYVVSSDDSCCNLSGDNYEFSTTKRPTRSQSLRKKKSKNKHSGTHLVTSWDDWEVPNVYKNKMNIVPAFKSMNLHAVNHSDDINNIDGYHKTVDLRNENKHIYNSGHYDVPRNLKHCCHNVKDSNKIDHYLHNRELNGLADGESEKQKYMDIYNYYRDTRPGSYKNKLRCNRFGYKSTADSTNIRNLCSKYDDEINIDKNLVCTGARMPNQIKLKKCLSDETLSTVVGSSNVRKKMEGKNILNLHWGSIRHRHKNDDEQYTKQVVYNNNLGMNSKLLTTCFDDFDGGMFNNKDNLNENRSKNVDIRKKVRSVVEVEDYSNYFIYDKAKSLNCNKFHRKYQTTFPSVINCNNASKVSGNNNQDLEIYQLRSTSLKENLNFENDDEAEDSDENNNEDINSNNNNNKEAFTSTPESNKENINDDKSDNFVSFSKSISGESSTNQLATLKKHTQRENYLIPKISIKSHERLNKPKDFNGTLSQTNKNINNSSKVNSNEDKTKTFKSDNSDTTNNTSTTFTTPINSNSNNSSIGKSTPV